jgi:hypothetical protein
VNKKSRLILRMETSGTNKNEQRTQVSNTTGNEGDKDEVTASPQSVVSPQQVALPQQPTSTRDPKSKKYKELSDKIDNAQKNIKNSYDLLNELKKEQARDGDVIDNATPSKAPTPEPNEEDKPEQQSSAKTPDTNNQIEALNSIIDRLEPVLEKGTTSKGENASLLPNREKSLSRAVINGIQRVAIATTVSGLEKMMQFVNENGENLEFNKENLLKTFQLLQKKLDVVRHSMIDDPEGRAYVEQMSNNLKVITETVVNELSEQITETGEKMILIGSELAGKMVVELGKFAKNGVRLIPVVGDVYILSEGIFSIMKSGMNAMVAYASFGESFLKNVTKLTSVVKGPNIGASLSELKAAMDNFVKLINNNKETQVSGVNGLIAQIVAKITPDFSEDELKNVNETVAGIYAEAKKRGNVPGADSADSVDSKLIEEVITVVVDPRVNTLSEEAYEYMKKLSKNGKVKAVYDTFVEARGENNEKEYHRTKKGFNNRIDKITNTGVVDLEQNIISEKDYESMRNSKNTKIKNELNNFEKVGDEYHRIKKGLIRGKTDTVTSKKIGGRQKTKSILKSGGRRRSRSNTRKVRFR